MPHDRIMMKPTKAQNKDFGLVMTLAATVVAVITGVWTWVYVALVMGVVTAVVPEALTPLSWCWFGLARVLERVMTSALLTVVYYLVVTPVGLLRRLTTKKDSPESSASTLHDVDHLYVPADFDRQFIDFLAKEDSNR